MSYQVIARKFRPQLFEEVVGQDPIVQTLRNAIGMDRIGHAYLFCGPRGVGKTTTARLLAKALNCAEGPTATPCNQCPSCTEIARGSSPDVLEIDAASNTGVDSIRELRENARYRPLRDRFKIFIVDEVHMLSTSAFNALLKILEEPPPHIAFIMATTERHKVPATILSRCQQFVFRTIPPAEIRDHLRAIADREGVTLGEGALAYIVRASEGSMRDAQSLLDQIIAFGGQNVRDEDVRDVLGFIPSELLDQAVDALAARDSRILVGIVAAVTEQGLGIDQFVNEFLGRVRDLLMARLEIPERISGSEDDRRRISAQAVSFSEQDLIRFFDILLKLSGDLRYTSEPRFHVEIACVKLAKVGRLKDIEDVLKDLGDHRGPDGTSNAPPQQPSGARETRVAPAPVPPAAPSRQEPGPPRARAATAPPGGSHPPPRGGNALAAASAPAPRKDVLRPVSKAAAPADAAIHENASKQDLVQRFVDVFKGDMSHVRESEPPPDPADESSDPTGKSD